MKYRTNMSEESSIYRINSNGNGRNEAITLIEGVSKSAFAKPKEKKTSISCIPSMGHLTVRPIGSPTHLEITFNLAVTQFILNFVSSMWAIFYRN